MKAELIEYAYEYLDWDPCRGSRTHSARKRAILFCNGNGDPVAVAIPGGDRVEISLVFLRDGKFCMPVWGKNYKIKAYKVAPFCPYSVVKHLCILPEYRDIIMHAVVCSMKIGDLKRYLLGLIRSESKDFGYRI